MLEQHEIQFWRHNIHDAVGALSEIFFSKDKACFPPSILVQVLSQVARVAKHGKALPRLITCNENLKSTVLRST